MSGARWTPGIGDPTVMGWATVIGYFLAALLCYRAGRRHADVRRIWWALAAFLTVLGINKQLDLQSWFTQVGRDLARSEGWYGNRRGVQRIFVLAIVGLGLGGSGVLLWIVRQRTAAERVAVVGLALLLAFIVVRAASFENVDLILFSTVQGIRFNWILELGGIAVIAAAASTKR